MLQKVRHKIFPPSPYFWENLEPRFKQVDETKAQLFVLWSNKKLSLTELKSQLLALVQSKNFSQSKLWLRDSSVKSFTLSDRSPEKLGKIVALVSIENDENASQFLNQIKAQGFSSGSYRVSKSIPLVYNCDWQIGEQSPGLISMSFFKKKAGLSAEAFKKYWFGAHTPFALDIHPLWNYERNAVEQCLESGMPEYDAIVPLHLKQDEDLQFSRFFAANSKNPLFNALRIQSDVEHFIDLKQIETVAMREFILS